MQNQVEVKIKGGNTFSEESVKKLMDSKETVFVTETNRKCVTEKNSQAVCEKSGDEVTWKDI
jgi:2-C-methyl-D-erythritol 4-phosphate cytidylyltransferase